MSRHRNFVNIAQYDDEEGDDYYDEYDEDEDDDYSYDDRKSNNNNQSLSNSHRGSAIGSAVDTALSRGIAKTTTNKQVHYPAPVKKQEEWEEDWVSDDDDRHYDEDKDKDYDYAPVSNVSKAQSANKQSKAKPPKGNANSIAPTNDPAIKAPKPSKASLNKKTATSLNLTPPKATPYSATPSPSPPPPSPSIAVPSAKHLREKAALLEKESTNSTLKPNLNLVIIGHVDQGKSTLVGHLLVLTGRVSQKLLNKYERESKEAGKSSFHFAWILDQTESERQRGVTSDVAYQHFETDSRRYTLLDAPGHRDFIPNMISGASLGDVAVLVVSAVRGEFEAGFSGDGQTREHALLAKAMGAQQLIVAVNKCEMVDWDQGRYEEIISQLMPFLRATGYRDKSIFALPLSGLQGDNILKKSANELQSWYTGPSLIELLEQLPMPTRITDKPTRITITDVYKTIAHGFCINGKIETGHIVRDDSLLVQPCNELVSIKSLSSHGNSTSIGLAGDSIEISVRDPSEQTQASITVGQWLSDPQFPIPIITQFHAQIITTNIRIPLLHGSSLVFYKQNYDQPIVLHKIRTILDPSTGAITKTNPRALYKNSTAEVEITAKKGICLDLFSENRALGRFTLRRGHETVAVGIVSKLIREASVSAV